MQPRSSGAAIALVAGLAVTLTACGGGDPAPAAAPTDDAQPVVVTSTDVYGAVARAVGGDLVTVTSLIDDPAADPHSYESTPADAAAMAGAQLVVFNGGGYDAFIPPLIDASGADPAVIDVVELSGLEAAAGAAEAAEPAAEAEGGHGHAEGEEAHGHEEGAEEGTEEGTEEHGHEHGALNEHVWYSLPTMQQLATRLATDLGALDPDDAAAYTANAEQFSAQIDELITKAEAVAAAHPGARIAVTEPVPGYLLETAGLTDVTPPAFTEAVEEDTDPPAAALAETLALFGPDPVAVLVANPQTATPSTDQVRAAAQTGGVPIVEFTETLPEGTTDYPSWMGAQIDALAGALDQS